MRVSPDGSRIADDEAIDGDVTTLWWPGDRNQSLGPTAAPLFTDPGAAWATGFDAAASRSGHGIAVIADDAAEAGGTPRRVALRLFEDREFQCEIPLDAADTFSSASPTFSPDGLRVAWAESDGIHVAGAGCEGEQIVTLPGAWEPFWSACSPPAAAPARLTLALRARARGGRVIARVTASAPATVRAGGRRVATTRVFRNAGTRTVRVRVVRAKRLVVRVSAAGATSVSRVVRRHFARGGLRMSTPG